MKNIKNTKKKKDVDKTKTKEYLNSCIIFVYHQNNIENISFLNEIKRYDDNTIEYKPQSHITELLKNIKVITSDICGLGKSYTIKKLIKKDNKKYFHFPLGGILSKTVIFQKLSILLKKIKKEYENNYQNIAIHLD